MLLAAGAGATFGLAHNYGAQQSAALARYNGATDPATASSARAQIYSDNSAVKTTQITSAVLAGLAAAAVGVAIYEVATVPPKTDAGDAGR